MPISHYFHYLCRERSLQFVDLGYGVCSFPNITLGRQVGGIYPRPIETMEVRVQGTRLTLI